MLKLTPDRMTQLSAVNAAVNRLSYSVDVARYNAPDFWMAIDDKHADYDDFAIEKRRRLLKLGFPTEALRLAIVEVDGQRRPILTVDSDRGIFVLDDKSVADLRKLPAYRLVERQVAGGGDWVATGDAPAPPSHEGDEQ